jgi:hypothetical protein
MCSSQGDSKACRAQQQPGASCAAGVTGFGAAGSACQTCRPQAAHSQLCAGLRATVLTARACPAPLSCTAVLQETPAADSGLLPNQMQLTVWVPQGREAITEAQEALSDEEEELPALVDVTDDLQVCAGCRCLRLCAHMWGAAGSWGKGTAYSCSRARLIVCGCCVLTMRLSCTAVLHRCPAGGAS